MVRERVQGPEGPLDAELLFEPGRLLVGNAGVLVTRVLYVKDNGPRRFVIVDAAMNDLIRPSLYDAWHEIVPLAQPAAEAALRPGAVVGPPRESPATSARPRARPHVPQGAMPALPSAAAYTFEPPSPFNSRPLVPVPR